MGIKTVLFEVYLCRLIHVHVLYIGAGKLEEKLGKFTMLLQQK